jgi:hypothetical protein
MTLYLILSHFLVAIIAFFICCNWHKRKNCNPKMDYNSSSLISDDATNTLVANFYNSLNQAFNPILLPPPPPGTPASPPPIFKEAALAYVTFSDLKKYISFIENLSRKNGLKNICDLGIRMYYGRYPITKNGLTPYLKNGVVDETVVGRHTLVFVPTFRDGERDIDFNPHHIEKGCPKRIPEIMEKKFGKRKQQEPGIASRQNIIIDTASKSGDGGSVPDNTDGVNLNTFGLTPPKNNPFNDAVFPMP